MYSSYVNYTEISPNLINALIAIEDNRFYSHRGIDFRGIARALYVNLINLGYKQGGSTITQQLAKIIFFNAEKSIIRKIRELFITFKLESLLNKKEILSLYLNRAYFGSGNYGIKSAANSNFHKQPIDLDIYESALLVSALKAPSRFNLIVSPDLTKKRASLVLNKMFDLGFISQFQFNEELQKLELLKWKKNFSTESRYFSDWILRRTSKNYNNTSDIKIKSTLDVNIQNITEKAALKILNDRNDLQVAVIVMDTSGAIKAMLGGTSYSKSQFNRATQSLRQTGSVFKLFTYLTAIDLGFNVYDKIDDLPLDLDGWKPKNYNEKYLGSITLDKSFAISSNVATIRLQEMVGRLNIIEWAKKLGISSRLKPERSLSLGTQSISLIEMTNAYASIASGGKVPFIYGVKEITDRNNNIIYKRNSSERVASIDKNVIKSLKLILKSSMDNGTSINAKLSFFNNKNILYGGKTGTTQNSKDAWFIGYMDNIIIGIWVGRDDNSQVENLSGGNQAAKIYREITKHLLGL
ncbi:MAG: penicillin-binding protein [Pelagibacterales bacterium]|nr:penicillin-binding protein [Pelagibacterales bacterium]